MRESDVQNSIRLALNPYAVIFRANVGTVKTADGRYFNTGLPKGYSDLSGYRKSDGKAVFIEVKNEKGKLRKDQEHFLNAMKQYPVIVGVARSPEDAIRIVEENHDSNRRVEELEERVRIFEMKYENTGSIFNRSHQINRIEALQEENNRYKQALEEVKNNASSYMGNSAARRLYDIADEALQKDNPNENI